MRLNIKFIIIILIYFTTASFSYADSNAEMLLGNGLRVFVKPMRAAPIVTINFWVKNGSIYESEGEAGFSELVSKLLFKSSLNYKDHALEKEFSKLSAKINKNSSNDCQSYCITGISKNFEKLLELGFEGLFASNFSENDIKDSISSLKNEIAELESMPDVVVRNAMMQEAFAIHPCRRPYYGLNPNFDGADLFFINRFYAKNYTPYNSILIITGDVDKNQVYSLLQKLSERYKGSSYSEPQLPEELEQKSYREVTKYANLQKAYLSFGWKIPVVESSDKYALYVLAKLLGGSEDSILWRRLVKGRQTSEFVCAEYEASRYQGIFVVSGITSKSKKRYFLDDVRQIVNGFVEEVFSENELEEVKKSIVNEDIYNRESIESCALDYGSFAVVSSALDAEKFENGIISVNVEDVRRVAIEYLRDENLSVAILQAPTDSDNSMPVMLTLENGMKLILKENHASSVISVSAKFLAGGLKEEKRFAGISQLAGLLLYKSLDTDEKTFCSKLEKIGAKLSYEANKNYVSVNMKSVASNFIPAFDIYIKMLDKPEFTSFYSKNRSVLENQLKIEANDICIQNEYNVLKALFGSYSPLGYSKYGRLDDLAKTKRADVIDFYKKNFVPANMVISVVGDFYTSEIRDYLLSSLGKLSNKNKDNKDNKDNNSKDSKTQTTDAIKFDLPVLTQIESENAYICFASKSVPTNSKKLVTIEVACRLLESYLKESFLEADNTGLMASTISIKNNSFISDGYFEANFRTNKENVATATRLLWLEIEVFKKNNISGSKIQNVKDSIYAEYVMKLTDSLALADIYSRDEILGLGFDFYSKYEDLLSSVSYNDIIEVARDYMLPEKKYIVGVSSSNSADLILEDNRLIFKQPKDTIAENKEDKEVKEEKTASENKDSKTSSNNTKNSVKDNKSSK